MTSLPLLFSVVLVGGCASTVASPPMDTDASGSAMVVPVPDVPDSDTVTSLFTSNDLAKLVSQSPIVALVKGDVEACEQADPKLPVTRCRVGFLATWKGDPGGLDHIRFAGTLPDESGRASVTSHAQRFFTNHRAIVFLRRDAEFLKGANPAKTFVVETPDGHAWAHTARRVQTESFRDATWDEVVVSVRDEVRAQVSR